MPEKHKTPHAAKIDAKDAAPAAAGAGQPEASGFKLPEPAGAPPPVPAAACPSSASAACPPAPQSATPPSAEVAAQPPGAAPVELLLPANKADTSARDFAFAGALLLVFLVASFFGKNAYANRLVGNRVPPDSANAAGWWLFLLLAALVTPAVLGMLVSREQFWTPVYLAAFAVVALAALVGLLVTGRR